jgi:hypothetical protein
MLRQPSPPRSRPLAALATRWRGVLRRGHALALTASLSGFAGVAPFQCQSEPDPAKALEETPGEALYELAEQFKARGDDDAWRDTLKYLIERYPSSRFAASARDDLADAGVTPEAEPAASASQGGPSRTASSPK